MDDAQHSGSDQASPGLTHPVSGTSKANNSAKKTRGKYTSRACLSQGEIGQHDLPDALEAHPSQQIESPVQPPLQSVQPSNQAPPDLDARMRQMENALQTLIQIIPRGTERPNVDLQETDEDGGFQGDTTFNAPVDAFNARLASLREQLGYSDTSSPSRRSDNEMTLNSASTVTGAGDELADNIRFGSRTLPFPSSPEYARYLDVFFNDINPCHPCINEPQFTSKCQKIKSTRAVDPQDACLLAINYIIFACADILTELSPVQQTRSVPGWKWYLIAEDLMNKRKLTGRGDLSLIQYLVYETFYLIHADMPNAAYNASGLACRLCFQFGLHQQRLWGSSCTPFSKHVRQRLFWTLYFVDRRTALSCGRPYGIRDSDIDVEEPAWIDDKALFPDKPIPDADPNHTFNIFLSGLSAFSRFAGEIWDQVFAVTSADDPQLGEKVAVLDARIKYWTDTVFHTLPLVPPHGNPTQRHRWQETLIRTRMSHLRLLLRRRTMVSLSYTVTDGKICGEVAMEIVGDILPHGAEARKPSCSRFHMAFSLGGAILILATLLCRDLSAVNLQEYRTAYMKSFSSGLALLRDISIHLHTARRILEDLRGIIEVVEHLIREEDGNPTQFEDISNVVPSNLEDLFPYGDINASFQPDLDMFDMQTRPQDFSNSDMAYIDGDVSMGLWAPWNNEGYGVPWV
ncbi:unnamed protein product [Clonostachys rosea]|uniref:Xylanolytic transcriptional activator regulatory domain-containing protein n=1 Tax=Bionectria ochroleuca TaxID=29856 RepID=A0ABY6UD91_BIOOC|nr:unnamed protein product [Clonostachys rosea]